MIEPTAKEHIWENKVKPMYKSLKKIKNNIFGEVKYTVRGDGIAHVRSSDLMKTDKFHADLESLKGIDVINNGMSIQLAEGKNHNA